VAAVDAPVLITADDRTAEWLARHIHDRSPRAAGPLVTVSGRSANAAAMLNQLLNIGYSELPAGSLMVTSIEQLPPEVQSQLSDAVAPQPGRPVLPLRLIATTSVPLLDQVEAGLFDERLFEQLNAVQISVYAVDRQRADLSRVWREPVRGQA
jgi:DNA-binding NtrC family response regulator